MPLAQLKLLFTFAFLQRIIITTVKSSYDMMPKGFVATSNFLGNENIYQQQPKSHLPIVPFFSVSLATAAVKQAKHQ